ncbi:MAG: ABC transporter substrate-binding protein [Thermovirgaceae bacterium]
MRKLLAVVLFVGLLATALPAAANDRVIFTDWSWESVQVHNRIAGYILEKGFDRDVHYAFSEEIPGVLGMERGDFHIAMEAWIDNAPGLFDRAMKGGDIVNLGRNFPDAPQGWYVPTYVIQGDPERGIEPMAPDLKSVKDLPKYWEVFKDPEQDHKGRLYNGPSGWNVSVVNEKKIEAYGLEDTYVAFYSGSASALATAIASNYEKGNPVLAYYWEPTPIIGMYDMTKLEEPPYDPKVWDTTGGCGFPTCRVQIIANSKFIEANPEIEALLKRYETTLEQTNAALAYMQGNEADVMKGAIWFLKNYPEDWKAWVADEGKIKKIEKALDKETL